MIHNLKSSKTNNKITDKYYNKYLKYKLKYLNLIHGGMIYEPQVKKENVKNILIDDINTKNVYEKEGKIIPKKLDLSNESTCTEFDFNKSSITHYINAEIKNSGIYTGTIRLENNPIPPFQYIPSILPPVEGTRKQPARQATEPQTRKRELNENNDREIQQKRYKKETDPKNWVSKYMTAENGGYLIYKLPILVEKHIHYLSNFKDRIDYFVYQGPYANDSFLPTTPNRLVGNRSYGILSGFKNIKRWELFYNSLTGTYQRNWDTSNITIRVFSFIGTFKNGLPVSGYGHFNLGTLKPESNIIHNPKWLIYYDDNDEKKIKDITDPQQQELDFDDVPPYRYKLNLPPGWEVRPDLDQGRIVYIDPNGTEHTYDNEEDEPRSIDTQSNAEKFDTQIYYGPMNFLEGYMNSDDVDFKYDTIKDLELPGSHEYILQKLYELSGDYNPRIEPNPEPRIDQGPTKLEEYFESKKKKEIENLKILDLDELKILDLDKLKTEQKKLLEDTIQENETLKNRIQQKIETLENRIQQNEPLKNRIQQKIQPTFIFTKYNTLYTGDVKNFKEDENSSDELNYFSPQNERAKRVELIQNTQQQGLAGINNVIDGEPVYHHQIVPTNEHDLPDDLVPENTYKKEIKFLLNDFLSDDNLTAKEARHFLFNQAEKAANQNVEAFKTMKILNELKDEFDMVNSGIIEAPTPTWITDNTDKNNVILQIIQYQEDMTEKIKKNKLKILLSRSGQGEYSASQILIDKLNNAKAGPNFNEGLEFIRHIREILEEEILHELTPPQKQTAEWIMMLWDQHLQEYSPPASPIEVD